MIRRLIGRALLWFIDEARRARPSPKLPAMLFTRDIEDAMRGSVSDREITETLELARHHLAQAHREAAALAESVGPHAPRAAS